MEKELNVIETSVLNLIPKGIGSRRTLAYIRDVSGYNIRQIQSAINRLILVHNVPICATRTGDGIFIPQTEEEREIGLRSFKSQIKEMIKRAQAVEDANLKTWDKEIHLQYQITLDADIDRALQDDFDNLFLFME
ncbi:hypothetical protein [Vagococcus xieshaowenii]|uniref:Uncharacterized protein n=1 Tax=Vagococcus xieshaowenii TaxID=2562451 RepID=A0AAJ5EHH9_9ENTE|nr:hypothetical protein [Vagococcus xieshaowenii]QCA28896.1 hypothetical protein E4Z98_06020 [Vagococcus xieshaowenii]TFZ43314.1 hypothetical protein E4031_00390 [Vagococcus xieshaowenii]